MNDESFCINLLNYLYKLTSFEINLVAIFKRIK